MTCAMYESFNETARWMFQLVQIDTDKQAAEKLSIDLVFHTSLR